MSINKQTIEKVDIDDVEFLRQVQNGIPLTKTPYKDIGNRLEMTEEEVINKMARLLKEGKIRRLAASIAHRKIGIVSNAMCVWKVPEERVDEVGEFMAGLEEVTHCYERPVFPGWEHNLYTMIHGYTDSECEKVIEGIKEKTGISDYIILYSEKEFKKVGARI